MRRPAVVPAALSVYGLVRNVFASTAARYHDGRKSSPVASTSLRLLPSTAPEKRLASDARPRRRYGNGLV